MIVTVEDLFCYLYKFSKSKRVTAKIDIRTISISVIVPSRLVRRAKREISQQLRIGIILNVYSDKIAYKKGLYK